jgi:hypothetical protein
MFSAEKGFCKIDPWGLQLLSSDRAAGSASSGRCEAALGKCAVSMSRLYFAMNKTGGMSSVELGCTEDSLTTLTPLLLTGHKAKHSYSCGKYEC